MKFPHGGNTLFLQFSFDLYLVNLIKLKDSYLKVKACLSFRLWKNYEIWDKMAEIMQITIQYGDQIRAYIKYTGCIKKKFTVGKFSLN